MNLTCLPGLLPQNATCPDLRDASPELYRIIEKSYCLKDLIVMDKLVWMSGQVFKYDPDINIFVFHLSVIDLRNSGYNFQHFYLKSI